MNIGLTVGVGNGKVFRHYVVGVGPTAGSVVDYIAEGIDRVAAIATVSEGGIGKGKLYFVTTDGQIRSGRQMDVGRTMDGGIGIGYRRECLWDDGIDKLPGVFTPSAVGIDVIIGDGSVSVVTHIDNRITCGSSGDHYSTASIGEGVGSRNCGEGGAGDKFGTVSRHRQRWQADDVCEGPVVAVSGAVCKTVGVGHRSLAVGHSSVNDRFAMADFDAAAVSDCRD